MQFLAPSVLSDSVIVPVHSHGNMETAVFDAFGRKYHVTMEKNKLRRLEDVPVYTSRDHVIRRESLATEVSSCAAEVHTMVLHGIT